MNEGGCLRNLLALLILAAIGGALTQCSSMFGGDNGDDAFSGPIPKRFQGAYNSIACGSGEMDGLVTVGGSSISYPDASFKAESKVSETDDAVTLRGRPLSAGGREPERTYVITYAAVGDTATLNGNSLTRCSKY